jgi:hypothetical protein
MYRSVMESQHSMLCCCGSSLSMPSEGCWLRGMFGYATRMQFDLYSLKAVVSHYLPSHYLPSKRQVSHGLILCLFDPDPDPDPVALGGLHPGVSSVHLSRRHWPTAFLPGESAALASDPLASPAGSPASGLLLVARKRAPTGRPQAGSYWVARKRAPTLSGSYSGWSSCVCGWAPWLLCVRCGSVVNPWIF